MELEAIMRIWGLGIVTWVVVVISFLCIGEAIHQWKGK